MTDPLFEKFLDERFARIEAHVAWVEKFLEQRATASEKTFDLAKAGLNELRLMATDAQIAFITKVEYAGKHELLATRIDLMASKLSEIISSNKSTNVIAYALVTIASLVIAGLATAASFIHLYKS